MGRLTSLGVLVIVLAACGERASPDDAAPPSALTVTSAGPSDVVSEPAVDPLSVVARWDEARNAGDVDRAVAVLDNDGSIFDLSMSDATDRERLRELLEAQAIAGHRVEDADCQVDGERVTCRYRQYDALLQGCGLVLTGEHVYAVRAGRLTLAHRRHDPESRDAAYAAAGEFRKWVEQHHPDAVDVIWASSGSITFTTPAGAQAMMAILPEYSC
jgi:hypothetical protein